MSLYDITADGQRFLVRATPGQAAQPLTVIVNWPALLKKEVPGTMTSGDKFGPSTLVGGGIVVAPLASD